MNCWLIFSSYTAHLGFYINILQISIVYGIVFTPFVIINTK
jgi:hypothetical protein